MKQAFLSYARADHEKARKLYNQLSKKLLPGVHVWFDKIDLPGGIKWDPAIRKAIRESDYFIAVLSNESVSQRGFRHSELREALEMAEEFPEDWIFLLPVRLEDCPLPAQVHMYNWTDLFPKPSDWNNGVEKICRDIKTSAAGRSVAGPTGKPIKIPATKPRPQPDRKPGASRTPHVPISYKVTLLDLGKRIPTIGRIASGLNRVQSTFRFTPERLKTPPQALTNVERRSHLYLTRLPKSFYNRIGLIKTDCVIGLSHPLLAFEQGDRLYFNYLTYQAPEEMRASFISYAGLDKYARKAGVTLDSAIAYVITAELVDYFLELEYHKQLRNCPMDFTRYHSDLVGGLQAGHFCRYCSRTLNNSQPFGEAFKAMIAWNRDA